MRFKEEYSFSPKLDREIEERSYQLWSRLIAPAREELKKAFKTEVKEKVDQKLDSISGRQLEYKTRERMLENITNKELPAMIESFKKPYLCAGLSEEIDRIALNYSKQIRATIATELAVYFEEDSDSEDDDDFDVGPVTSGWPASWSKDN